VKLLAAACLALTLAAPAAASEQHPTLGELEGEVMCPTCKTTLDLSTSPIAERIRTFISARITAGDTKSQIKRKLVLQFGPGILAEPPKHGFNLLAWVLTPSGARPGFGRRRAARSRDRAAARRRAGPLRCLNASSSRSWPASSP
jgi:cytochrome c-type biogenesis protein CcmH/NrfF